MNSKKDISILVVTHNHDEYIQKLIDSLEKFQYDKVFFCDANSNDSTLKILKNSKFKDNLLVKSKLEGFSKNNNDLISHFNLDSKYFLLLNPDLYFDEDFILKLFNRMEYDNNIAIATPLVYYPNGDLQTTWKKFPGLIHVVKKRLGLITAKQEKQLQSSQIDWCLGACMLISDKLLKPKKMLLDERYRLYCEDIDICFEAKTKGMKVVGVEDAYAYHHLNELSTKSFFNKYNYWNICSIVKFAIKWNWKYYVKKNI